MWWLLSLLLAVPAAVWLSRPGERDLSVVTVFANHKGGVGKSTLSFLAARRYAERFPDEKVLLIDCTVYGDVTRLFGDSAPSVQEALERRWCCGGSAKPQASDRVPNLHLLASNGSREVPPKAVLRDLLKLDGPWTVFVDTDGGDVTPLTRLALRSADNIIVPSHPNDVRRIERFVKTTEDLNLSFHGKVVFNRVRVKKLEDDGFEPHDMDQIEAAERTLHKRLGEHTHVSDERIRDACKFAARLYDEPFAKIPDGMAGDLDRIFY